MKNIFLNLSLLFSFSVQANNCYDIGRFIAQDIVRTEVCEYNEEFYSNSMPYQCYDAAIKGCHNEFISYAKKMCPSKVGSIEMQELQKIKKSLCSKYVSYYCTSFEIEI